MAVLRIFGRRKFPHTQARAWESKRQEEQNEQEGQNEQEEQNEQKGQNMANGMRNEWAGPGMVRTTPVPPPAQSAGPPEAESMWIGTRRYLAHLPYTLPKDAPEADRLNFQHYYFRRLFKGLYLVPPREPVNSILDMGCGTGRWAHEMALEFPHARVVGLDIEVPRPGTLPMPANLSFLAANVLEPLPFADYTFDFVHQRMLGTAIPTAQWPAVIAELVRVTRPGGQIELIEATDTYLNAGPALAQFLAWNRALNASRGIDLSRLAYLDELLLSAGLTQVEKRTIQVAVGSWGGRLGRMLAQNTLATFASMRGLYEQVLAVPAAQLFQACAEVEVEFKFQTYAEFVILCFSQEKKIRGGGQNLCRKV